MSKINLHVIGGLGDVSLTRKLPAIYNTDMDEEYNLASVVDVYPEEVVRDASAFSGLLDLLKKNRLKGKVNEGVMGRLVEDVAAGRVAYHSVQNSASYSGDFFRQMLTGTNAIDISSPNRYHLNFFKDAVERSRAHILIEKPFVASVEDLKLAQRFLASCNGNLLGRVLMNSEHYSHYGNVRDYLLNLENYISGDFSLGRVRQFILRIKEAESFGSQRNRDTIDVRKSGGGIWLDLGVHALSFLRTMGGVIDGRVEANPYKLDDEAIAGEEYGETAMDVNFNLVGENFLEGGCPVEITVGKGFRGVDKRFMVGHERGVVDLDVRQKKVAVYNAEHDLVDTRRFDMDAFYYVFSDFAECIRTKTRPYTSVEDSVGTLTDLFSVYGCAAPMARFVEE